MKDFKKEDFTEDFFVELNTSLAKQVEGQLNEEKGKSPDTIKKKRHLWFRIVAVLFTMVIVAGGSGLWYTNYLFSKMKYDTGSPVEQQAEYFEQDTDSKDIKEEVDPDQVDWGEKTSTTRKEDGVINILLVGEEAMGEGSARGRTDSIMVATVNTKQKSLKLTSIMRDTYVQIPEYSDNKINAAYHNGGVPLLKETLKLNFDLEVDGYILVDFDSFETVIDKLGGVEITLSQTEANYLNRTNYISDPSNRNVYAGTQTLNGNQALGYARVRYVPNEDQSDDFGRTSRQRKVLNALFEKYKQKSELELVTMLPGILSTVTTDIKKTKFIEYIASVVTLGAEELETFRIPIDGAYQISRIRGMSVLLPKDLSINAEALHQFIFGEETNVSEESPVSATN